MSKARKLLKGRYYWHRDASVKGMHPSYIYKKNDKKNKYNIVCFTSSPGKKRIKLKKILILILLMIVMF